MINEFSVTTYSKDLEGLSMKFSDNELPSNRKFGVFFTLVFSALGAYFYYIEYQSWGAGFALLAAFLLLITLLKSESLTLLNKLWMRLGFLMGAVVSPVILGIIFFGVFTPIGTLLRFRGRDELRVRCTEKSSYWISREEPITSESFKNQF